MVQTDRPGAHHQVYDAEPRVEGVEEEGKDPVRFIDEQTVLYENLVDHAPVEDSHQDSEAAGDRLNSPRYLHYQPQPSILWGVIRAAMPNLAYISNQTDLA